MINQTPTPETDAQYKEYARRDNNIQCVAIDFARKLERERDEAMKTCAKIDLSHRLLEKERDQLKAELEETSRKLSDVEYWANSFDETQAQQEIGKLCAKLTATEAMCERLAEALARHAGKPEAGLERKALADYAKMKEVKL